MSEWTLDPCSAYCMSWLDGDVAGQVSDLLMGRMGREVCCVAPDIHMKETIVREAEKKRQAEEERRQRETSPTADGPQVGGGKELRASHYLVMGRDDGLVLAGEVPVRSELMFSPTLC